MLNLNESALIAEIRMMEKQQSVEDVWIPESDTARDTQKKYWASSLSTSMELVCQTIKKCLWLSLVFVGFAEKLITALITKQEILSGLWWIMTIKQKRSEVFCVTGAI